jgi:hypothetical protein
MSDSVEMYVRTQWWPNQPIAIEMEMARVGKVIFNDNAIRIVGAKWYRPERSGSTEPIPIGLEEIRSGLGWLREELVQKQYMYRLVLANGLEGDSQEDVSGTVFYGLPNPNKVVLSLPEPIVLAARGIEFRDVLSMAEDYASELHGVSVVASSRLFARAREYGLTSGDKAVYAAFWGSKQSNPDPLYERLEQRGINAPHNIVACNSWRDLESPNAKAIEAAQDLLA